MFVGHEREATGDPRPPTWRAITSTQRRTLAALVARLVRDARDASPDRDAPIDSVLVLGYQDDSAEELGDMLARLVHAAVTIEEPSDIHSSSLLEAAAVANRDDTLGRGDLELLPRDLDRVPNRVRTVASAALLALVLFLTATFTQRIRAELQRDSETLQQVEWIEERVAPPTEPEFDHVQLLADIAASVPPDLRLEKLDLERNATGARLLQLSGKSDVDAELLERRLDEWRTNLETRKRFDAVVLERLPSSRFQLDCTLRGSP